MKIILVVLKCLLLAPEGSLGFIKVEIQENWSYLNTISEMVKFKSGIPSLPNPFEECNADKLCCKES